MTTTSPRPTMATPLATDKKTPTSTAELANAPLSPRARIARLMLFYHFSLIVASCAYYIARGFDLEEFTSLMGILAPVTALYGGAVFRFIGRSITEPNLGNVNNAPVNSLVKWLVHGHFIMVLFLVSLKALAPNVLNFHDMTMFLTFIESAVGVYMGNIVLALFEEKKER